MADGGAVAGRRPAVSPQPLCPGEVRAPAGEGLSPAPGHLPQQPQAAGLFAGPGGAGLHGGGGGAGPRLSPQPGGGGGGAAARPVGGGGLPPAAAAVRQGGGLSGTGGPLPAPGQHPDGGHRPGGGISRLCRGTLSADRGAVCRLPLGGGREGPRPERRRGAGAQPPAGGGAGPGLHRPGGRGRHRRGAGRVRGAAAGLGLGPLPGRAGGARIPLLRRVGGLRQAAHLPGGAGGVRAPPVRPARAEAAGGGRGR